MALSNVAMQQAMEQGRILIDPQPLPLRPAEGQVCPYDTHSVNLRLGSELSIPLPGPYSFDLALGGNLSSFLTRNSERITIPKSGYALERFQFVLGITLEYLSLPVEHPVNLESGTCLAARIEGRSSIARCGVLVHFTAPTVHPGFDGTLTLEIINLGPTHFILRPEMPIAQLIIEEVQGIPFEKTDRAFKGQRTPEGPVADQAPPGRATQGRRKGK
jgi:dCTP deaminase